MLEAARDRGEIAADADVEPAIDLFMGAYQSRYISGQPLPGPLGGGDRRHPPARARRAPRGMTERPAVAVRRATPADAAVVAALLHDFNVEFATPTPPVEVLAQRLERLLDGEDVVALLALEPAAAVALMTFRPNVWYAGPVALLDELYVRPDLRGGGIGSALLARACSLARDRGAELMEINVDEVDVDARRFYERHEFSNTEPGGTHRMLYYEREL